MTDPIYNQSVIMDSLRHSFGSLKLPAHFVIYCFTFMLYAAAMSGLGPYIPYLADTTGHKETQYAYLFFCKSAGFFVGSLLLRLLQNRVQFHKILMWSSIMVFISMVLFSYVLNFLIQGFCLFLVATFISIINIMINICVTETQRGGNPNFWLHVLHGSYGIGGLISPFIIYTFELNSYLIIGILMLVTAPFYFKLSSPDLTNKNYKEIISAPIYQMEIQQQMVPQKYIKKKYIGYDSQYLLCFLFWTYIGIELGFANWISSYAMLKNIATKEQSLSYNSMFWISMTLFRFVSSFLPLRSMRKLMIHQSMLMACTAVCMLMIFSDQVQNACILSSITFGMCFSAMYPLFLSLPLDYNLQISSAQMANIALWSALGEATLALSFGLFMEWLGANSLFYITFIMTIILIFMTQYLEELYVKESKKGQEFKRSQLMVLKERQNVSSEH